MTPISISKGKTRLFEMARKFKHRKDLRLITSSFLYDANYYSENNPDVRNAGLDPALHFLLFGGVEGRNPSDKFNCRWYLTEYEDVRRAGINPLLHYLIFGQKELRRITPGDSDDTIVEVQPEIVLSAEELTSILKNMLRSKYKLSISHDDYLESTGGTQIFIADEQTFVNHDDESYLHVYPYTPKKYLSREDTTIYVGINLDGKHLGETDNLNLIRALKSISSHKLISVNIHHTKGFTLPFLRQLFDLSVCEKFFWLHDYFSLCPSYNLLRNDREFCGAPDITSNACEICKFHNNRLDQQNSFNELFELFDIKVVAPSVFTYELWKRKFPKKDISGMVKPLTILNWQQTQPGNVYSGKLKVGFIGYPFKFKGWSEWIQLIGNLEGNKDLEFFHFSNTNFYEGRYRIVPTKVHKDNRNAMVENLRQNGIDVAVLWSLVPETFSFVLHEALAAGCYILTNPKSGNIQDYILHNPDRGMVLPDLDSLIEIFRSGQIIRKVLDYQRYGRPMATLSFGQIQEPKQ